MFNESSPALIEAPAVEQAPKAKRGRPAKYASAAERQAAYRAKHEIKMVRLDGKLAGTIEKLADQYETDQTLVINNLLRFALANRNWSTQGMGGWTMSDSRCLNGKRAAAAPSEEAFNAANI